MLRSPHGVFYLSLNVMLGIRYYANYVTDIAIFLHDFAFIV